MIVKEVCLYQSVHEADGIGNGYAVEWQGFSWGCVKIGSQVGWVSGEYSEITTE